MSQSNSDLTLRDDSSLLLLRTGLGGLLLRPHIKAGSSISGGTFSRRRWHDMVEVEEKARQAAIDEREREQARRLEAKRKARAAAEAARKAKQEAELRDLRQSTSAAIEGSRAAAAQAAHASMGTLESLRLAAIAAAHARQFMPRPREPEPPAKVEVDPWPARREMVKEIMRRNIEKHGLK